MSALLVSMIVGCGGTTMPPPSIGDGLAKGFFYVNDEDQSDKVQANLEKVILANDKNGNKSAYEFNGDTSAIEIPHESRFNPTTTVTLAAWVNTRSQKSAVILRKGAEVNGPTLSPYELGISANHKVIFSLNLDGNWNQLRSNDYTVGDWFHVAGTYDGTNMKLYINGSLVNSKQINGTIGTANMSPLLIGTRLKMASSTWDGTLADIRFYDKALGSIDIARLAGQ